VNQAGETTLDVAVCQQGEPLGGAPGSYWSIESVVEAESCFAPSYSGVDLVPDGGTTCADRPILPCTLAGPFDTPQIELDNQIATLVEGCGHIGLAVGADFAGGCATSVYSNEDPSVSTPILQCLAAQVFALRFACADGLSCGQVIPRAYP
jgi:hypothetical protein